MTWSGVQSIITYNQEDEPANPDFGDIWHKPSEPTLRCWVERQDGDETPHWREFIQYTAPE